MLHKIDNIQNKKYTFIIKSDWIESIVDYDLVMENGVYKKYNSTLNGVEGELIICNDLTKLDKFCNKTIQETYQDYLEFIEKRDFTKEQWVYNILDGQSEQDKILFRNEQIVIIPCYTWSNTQDIEKMHLLVFPLDKKIHSIRDLNSTHIDMLEYSKEKTLEIIKDKYGLERDLIKMYFHYSPSTYHLHIHFVQISNTDVNSSVEYSHELSSVIENLKINSDYYKLVKLNKRI